MSPDEARDAFGDAHDGLLDDETRAAFEAALETDEALRAEFARYQELCRAAASLDEGGPTPDLLQGVQKKIRERSGGRFFRDRYSERARAGTPLPIVLAAAMLVVLLVAWVLLERTVLLAPDPHPPSTTTSRD
ncbi:MAG: hypothetical protein IT379_20215 [Deltaproteobacteria bacterium]|nr:hypothetical protein [Deltaproteobacteria bacterium]